MTIILISSKTNKQEQKYRVLNNGPRHTEVPQPIKRPHLLHLKIGQNNSEYEHGVVVDDYVTDVCFGELLVR